MGAEKQRITAVKAKRPIVPPPNLEILIEIDGVPIFSSPDGKYICFVSDLDVCTDGTGDDHGDPYYQPQTAYYNGGEFLNADVDKYIVIPPQVRMMPEPVVLGCEARLTRLDTGKHHAAVTGEIGPENKTGEAAICLAQILRERCFIGHGWRRRNSRTRI